jgi:sporulation protein YlmC with PRC-barrel domain
MEPNTRTARIVTEGKASLWDTEGPGPRVMAADTLEGDRVRNAAGEDLGTIEHIMIDVPAGRVAYAVVSYGGFLGMGDKLFAVPWKALTLNTTEKCFMLNASKDRLQDAPGFDKDHWPSMADESWARDLHTYYGTHPYWDEDAL